MNKFLVSLFAIFVFSCGTAFSAFSSITISTVTCSVSFPISVPTISHAPLTRISSIYRIAVTTGTAADSLGLSAVSMSYWTDNNSTVVASTISLPSWPKTYSFQFSIPSVSAGANTFYYYLIATNNNSTPVKTPTYTVPINSGTGPQTVTSSGGTIILPSGDESHGNTYLLIPPGALSAPESIAITELSPNDSSIQPYFNTRPVAAYLFTPAGLLFLKSATLCLYFPSASGLNANGLKIMWWDGIDWRFVGGTVNSNTDTVTAYISHFSLYAVFPVSAISDDDYRPKEKIITPYNQDGINDYATFGGLSLDDTVNIYDVRGRRVRKLSDTNIWDGRDDSGNFVQTGVYVYQIKTNGKVISGVIAVAK